MNIIIGRDGATSRLKLTDGQNPKLFGAVGSVPMTVSREHCKLTIDASGTYRLENLKASNDTFVNGQAIISKAINKNDRIELGPEHYPVSWEYLNQFAQAATPKMMDIRPLKLVWDNYERETQQDIIAERKFNTLRSTTGLIVMAAVALSFLVGHSTPYLILYGSAIVISVLFTLKAYKDAAARPKIRQQKKLEFTKRYKCSCCGHHYKMEYIELAVYDKCPYCGATFIK